MEEFARLEYLSQYTSIYLKQSDILLLLRMVAFGLIMLLMLF